MNHICKKNMSDSSPLIHSQILYQTSILTNSANSNKLTLFHIFVQSPLCIGFHIEYGTSAHKLPHWSCCKLGWLHFYTVVHQEVHLVPNGIQVHRCNLVWPFMPRPFGFIPGFQVHRRVIHSGQKCFIRLACLWSKIPMFLGEGMREGGKPLPRAFQYLILMI